MKTTDGQPLQIGDTILSEYHDICLVGVNKGYDGSGCVYVDFPSPLPEPIVYGSARDGICFHYHDTPRVYLVSRPAEVPELYHAPASCLGGSTARNGTLSLPSLDAIEVAGKAAVARRDHSGAAALRAAYKAVRAANVVAA